MTTPGHGYQPIFRSILDSSIARDFAVRHVFEDLLKLADFRTGIVDMTPDAIARRTNAPLDLIERALAELEEPDPLSRNTAEDGRRIVRLEPTRPWGWWIVNFRHYREVARLEGKARRQAAYRERKAEREGRGDAFRRARNVRVTEEASRGDARRRDTNSSPPTISRDGMEKEKGKRKKGKEKRKQRKGNREKESSRV